MGLDHIDQEIYVAVDAVVCREVKGNVELLLVKRKNDPWKGKRALPGGFVENDETLEEAVVRELGEETGVQITELTQVATFSAPERDPRGRVISTVFLVLVEERVSPQAGSDADEVAFFPIDDLPELAFDHEEMIARVVERILEDE